MKFHKEELQLTYDDVLLIPQKSLNSRNDVKLEYIPIIPAPMTTVSSPNLCIEQLKSGGIAILERYYKDKKGFFNELITQKLETAINCFFGVGLNLEEVEELIAHGVSNFCIDIANGYSDKVIDLIKVILKRNRLANIIAGNIATVDGYIELWKAGANYIRVGIGGGSLCTTRLITGHGFPNLSCINDIYEASTDVTLMKRLGAPPLIIADGGIRNSGDCVKALAAGADFCMLGKYFAGCKENSSEIITGKDNKLYVRYAGMASAYTQSKVYGKVIAHPEGVTTLVEYKGTYQERLNLLLMGIKSGLSYSNAENIGELRSNAKFIKVSSNTLIENHPHGQNLELET